MSATDEAKVDSNSSFAGQLARIDVLYKARNFSEAKSMLDTLERNPNLTAPQKCGVKWRLARHCSRMTWEIDEGRSKSGTKAELVQQGIKFVQEALRLDQHNAAAHKWYVWTVHDVAMFRLWWNM